MIWTISSSSLLLQKRYFRTFNQYISTIMTQWLRSKKNAFADKIWSFLGGIGTWLRSSSYSNVQYVCLAKNGVDFHVGVIMGTWGRRGRKGALFQFSSSVVYHSGTLLLLLEVYDIAKKLTWVPNRKGEGWKNWPILFLGTKQASWNILYF